jgi:SlyX protein
MSGSLEERLTELEVRLAFVDETMLSLSDTIARHDRHLHEMRNAIEALRSDLLVVRGTLGDAAHDEPPPPHY